MADSLSPHGEKWDLGDIGISGDDLPPFEQGPIDLRAWFDEELRGLPLELEIGSGKGTFLVQQGLSEPGVCYIGVEYASAYWRYGADRCRRHGLRNVRMLRTEADFFVRNYVHDETFRQVHIYFPDPWPKKRHNKRRLVQAPFLREVWRILKPTDEHDPQRGQLRLATDHSDYFAWMEEHASQVADLFERLPFESPASAGEGELVGTNFERKYRREGRPFHAMILRKQGRKAASVQA